MCHFYPIIANQRTNSVTKIFSKRSGTFLQPPMMWYGPLWRKSLGCWYCDNRHKTLLLALKGWNQISSRLSEDINYTWIHSRTHLKVMRNPGQTLGVNWNRRDLIALKAASTHMACAACGEGLLEWIAETISFFHVYNLHCQWLSN